MMLTVESLPQDIDAEIIEQFYEYTSGALSKFKNLVNQSFVDEEDLKQDIVIRALRYYPKFRGDCQLRSWVYTIAKSHLLNCKNRVKGDMNKNITYSLKTEYEFDEEGTGDYHDPLAGETLEEVVLGEFYNTRGLVDEMKKEGWNRGMRCVQEMLSNPNVDFCTLAERWHMTEDEVQILFTGTVNRLFEGGMDISEISKDMGE